MDSFESLGKFNTSVTVQGGGGCMGVVFTNWGSVGLWGHSPLKANGAPLLSSSTVYFFAFPLVPVGSLSSQRAHSVTT